MGRAQLRVNPPGCLPAKAAAPARPTLDCLVAMTAWRLCCSSLSLTGQMLPRSCPLLPYCPRGSARPQWLQCRRRRLWREECLTQHCMQWRPSALGLLPRCMEWRLSALGPLLYYLMTQASAARLQHHKRLLQQHDGMHCPALPQGKLKHQAAFRGPKRFVNAGLNQSQGVQHSL